GQREQRVQGAGRVVHVLPWVTEPGEPLRHGADREGLRVAVRHLGPGQRGGYPGVAGGPDGIRRCDRPVLGVLVVIDEDAVALLSFPRWGGGGGAARRSISRASATAARRTWVKVQRGSIRA